MVEETPPRIHCSTTLVVHDAVVVDMVAVVVDIVVVAAAVDTAVVDSTDFVHSA